jgi:predicted anti-sigma-YlaC factor YlaD
MALNGLAESLAASGDVFASDDDPELVRDALPFALKTMESLLAETPRHRGLLLATCRSFTQYSFAFVEADADLIEVEDYRRAAILRQRAIRLYLRARDYGLRGLELDAPGITQQLTLEPEVAAGRLDADSLELMFWTGAAWGAATSLGKDRPELLADTDAVRAMLARALDLDESLDRGSLHEVMIAIDSLPEAMGGSMERARRHFQRALELSGGRRAGTYVTMAKNVSVAEQNRPEFEALLHKALAIDPDAEPELRLANLINQRLARALLEQADELFLDWDSPKDEDVS